jgi:hypothetical protein
VLVRFAYLAVSRAFAALWLLRMSDREKDVEILALRDYATRRPPATWMSRCASGATTAPVSSLGESRNPAGN